MNVRDQVNALCSRLALLALLAVPLLVAACNNGSGGPGY